MRYASLTHARCTAKSIHYLSQKKIILSAFSKHILLTHSLNIPHLVWIIIIIFIDNIIMIVIYVIIIKGNNIIVPKLSMLRLQSDFCRVGLTSWTQLKSSQSNVTSWLATSSALMSCNLLSPGDQWISSGRGSYTGRKGLAVRTSFSTTGSLD